MKNIGVFTVLFTSAVIGVAADAPARNPVEYKEPPILECPHCGDWQISRANRSGFVSEVISIDNDSIEIPHCGKFGYALQKVAVSPGGRSRRYDVTLSLTGKEGGVLCQVTQDESYAMTIEVSGHFQEGGTAEMAIRANGSNDDLFYAFAWNQERENPGEAGSAYGSIAAVEIDHAATYAVLSREVESAYQRLTQQKRIPKAASFNIARFAAKTLNFCEYRNRENGYGGWPFFWARECQSERLTKKLNEFVAWQSCMDKNGSNMKACKFPDEKFDKSPKRDEDQW